MFGLSFSNGFDERLLMRISDNFIYKINAQTNFDADYSFGTELALNWMRQIRLFNRMLWIRPSIGFQQYNLSSQNFFHRDIYLSSVFYMQHTELLFKTGYQVLNDVNNLGATVGLQRRFLYSLHSNMFLIGYYGVSVGYYFDYFTYSAYFQGRISRNVYYQLTYDRINNHDFFNVGLSYLFNRRRR